MIRTVATACAVVAPTARADWALNLQAPVTRIARDIFDLHTMLLLVCVTIFVVVFAVIALIGFAGITILRKRA